jgi:hypothetical protein
MSQPVWIQVKELHELARGLAVNDRIHPGPPLVSTESPQRSHYDCGGASMGGIATSKTYVFVVEERAPGPRQGCIAYAAPCTALSAELAEALSAALHAMGGFDVGVLLRDALQRGDDLVKRAGAADALLSATLLPTLIRHGFGAPILLAASDVLQSTEGLARTLTLAAARLACDAAMVENSTLVTAMGCNGSTFGIRVSGIHDRWFEAPWSHDASDGAGMLLLGLGAFAAPLGANIAAQANEITIARHDTYAMFGPEMLGVPIGMDVRRIVATGVLPPVTEACEPAPWACFAAAIEAFAQERGIR